MNPTGPIGMPPFLKVGHVLMFRDPGHLMLTLQVDLAQERLSAVDLAGTQLTENLEIILRIEGYSQEKRLSATVVHRDGDVIGLHAPCGPARLSELAMFSQHAAQALGWTPPAQATASVEHGHPEETDTGSVQPGLEQETYDDGNALLVSSDDEIRLDDSSVDTSRVSSNSEPPPVTDSKSLEGLETTRFSPPRPEGSPAVRLEGVSSPLELVADVKPHTLFRALVELHSDKKGGLLELQSGAEIFWMQIGVGGTLDDFSGDVRERLFNSGLLSGDDGDALDDDASAAAAVSRVLLKEHKAKEILRIIFASITVNLTHLLGLRGVRSKFAEGATMHDVKPLRLPLDRLIQTWLGELFRSIRVGELETHLAPHMDEVPQLVAQCSIDPINLVSDDRTKRLVEVALPKGETLRRLLRFSPLNKGQTMRFLLGLEALGLLRYGRDKGSTIEVNGTMATLKAVAARGTEGYYEALGLHVTSHPDEYREAIEKLRSEYGPDGDLAQSSKEAGALCSQIVNHALAAYDVLKLKPARIVYRSERYTQTELAGFSSLLREKMKLALLRGNERRARQLQEVALELDPKGFRRAMASAQEDD